MNCANRTDITLPRRHDLGPSTGTLGLNKPPCHARSSHHQNDYAQIAAVVVTTRVLCILLYLLIATTRTRLAWLQASVIANEQGQIGSNRIARRGVWVLVLTRVDVASVSHVAKNSQVDPRTATGTNSYNWHKQLQREQLRRTLSTTSLSRLYLISTEKPLRDSESEFESDSNVPIQTFVQRPPPVRERMPHQ
jgi:hypothetical protein